jgi:hypothetical protein
MIPYGQSSRKFGICCFFQERGARRLGLSFGLIDRDELGVEKRLRVAFFEPLVIDCLNPKKNAPMLKNILSWS